MALYDLLFWLFIIVISSYMLAEGADRLGVRIGRRFIGRTVLGVVTTFPEFVIVYFAALKGFYDVGIGAVFGSNILMISLGLAVAVLIATTRLSLRPTKEINTNVFKLDFYFMLLTAVFSVILFIDGYDIIDGIIFALFYFAYVYLAFKESKIEREETLKQELISRTTLIISTLLVIFGGLGIMVGGGPFIDSVKNFSAEAGIPAVILALLIAPIAGEMPEKLSLYILARKGGKSLEITIGNIFGSKILNNTLLITTFIVAVIIDTGKITSIPSHEITFILVAWTAILTIVAMITFADDKLSRKDGLLLLALYIITIVLQYFLIPIGH
jgi:cation:H+ antiporter